VNSARAGQVRRRPPVRRRERQESLAQIGAVGPAGQELAALKLGHRAGDLGLVHVGAGTDGFAGHDAELAQADQDPPFRYSNAVLGIDPGQRLGHQAGQHFESVRQELAELQQLLLRLLLGLVRLAAGFRIAFELGRGVGTSSSLNAPLRQAAEGCVGAATRSCDHGGSAPVRNGGLCRSEASSALSALSSNSEHSMATNSSVLVTPTGMAPVISSRSTLRNEAACVNSRERQ
jgi:hypothetical protein